jgi:hypothetical protein
MEKCHDSAMTALLSQRDAALALKVSVRTLERWRVNGGGPLFVKYGRKVGYRDCDLEAWLAAHVVPNTSAGRA